MMQDEDEVNSKTMLNYDSGTMVPDRTLVASHLAEELGTMVINSDPEDESTMKSKALVKTFYVVSFYQVLFGGEAGLP